MMHKPLHIILPLLFFISVPFPAAASEDRHLPINIDHTTFEESITELSEIFDMEITLVNFSDLPQHKFKLKLEQATFIEAAQEAMRKAGLQSHAMVLDQQKKTARIWILRAGSTDSMSRMDIENNIKTIIPKQFKAFESAEAKNMKMMTPEEFARLEPEAEENFRGMTPEEFDSLEPEAEEKLRGMTPEEFEALEPEESENFRGMTQEEYGHLEPEAEKNFRGMTPEAFAKLKK